MCFMIVYMEKQENDCNRKEESCHIRLLIFENKVCPLLSALPPTKKKGAKEMKISVIVLVSMWMTNVLPHYFDNLRT